MDKDIQASIVSLALPTSVPLVYTARWSGEDGSGSGLAHYEVQVRDLVTGEWSPYLSETSHTETQVVADQRAVSGVQVRVGDQVGNLGEWDTQDILSLYTETSYYPFNGQPVAIPSAPLRGRCAVRQGIQVSYLHTDHLGSVSLITEDHDDNPLTPAQVLYQARYAPYGQVRWTEQGSPTDKAFTGQRAEVSLGLMDYNARFYSPMLGRFISPDSIVPDPTNPLAYDRYQYVYSNPLRYTDDSGHCPVCLVIVGIGVALVVWLANPESV